jgi:hypothetical protein
VVEKLKQLVAAYQDEFASLKRQLEDSERAGTALLELALKAKMDIVRAHAIQLQGVIEGECGEWVELVKSFG